MNKEYATVLNPTTVCAQCVLIEKNNRYKS